MTDTTIFLSHSHKDNEYCETLVKRLESAGMDVWFDEEKLDEGELGEVIERELQLRDVFVVVLSPDALASRWVEKETRMFDTLQRDEPVPRRKLVPVVARPIVERRIWLFLRDFKRQQGPGGAALSADEAAVRILHVLRSEAPLATPALASSPLSTPTPAPIASAADAETASTSSDMAEPAPDLLPPAASGSAPPPLPTSQRGWRWVQAALITIGALLTCVAFARTDLLGLGIYVAGLSLVAAGLITALVTMFRRQSRAWRLLFALSAALCGAIQLFFVLQDDVKAFPQLLVIFAASAIPADALLVLR
jgi:TIR domain-containing protein